MGGSATGSLMTLTHGLSPIGIMCASSLCPAGVLHREQKLKLRGLGAGDKRKGEREGLISGKAQAPALRQHPVLRMTPCTAHQPKHPSTLLSGPQERRESPQHEAGKSREARELPWYPRQASSLPARWLRRHRSLLPWLPGPRVHWASRVQHPGALNS